MKQRWGLVGLVGAVGLFSGGWLLHGAAGPRLSPEQLFERVFNAVGTYYVDSLPADSLFRKATDGLLFELNDPYSTMVEGEDYRQLTEQTTGNYGGLGIQIDVRDGFITVVAPLPQSPAERAGMEAGDQIVTVDGKNTQGLKQDEAIKTLRGTPGSRVTVQVRRPGMGQLIPFSLTRETIHFRSVQPATVFEGNIGLVQLTPVSETSSQELRDEINALRTRGMTRLILDLRGNPGGLLDQGAEVSDLFLDPGQQIVSTRGRAEGVSRNFAARSDQAWPELPVVVLVNAYTASAAEIIAGALQDNDRAVILGTPTFGKGLVQSLFNLGDGRALKLTTARWFTPSGRSIQREVRSEADQAERLAELESGVDSTATDSLPTHKTISGRIVRGGGGIVPDRIVRLDSLTTAERLFARAVGSNVEAYRDALVGVALEVKRRGGPGAADFVVTDAMVADVFARLEAKEVRLTVEERAGGDTLVREQLGYEVARYGLGRQAELTRKALDDAQVRAATALLKAATSPRALMAQITGE